MDPVLGDKSPEWAAGKGVYATGALLQGGSSSVGSERQGVLGLRSLHSAVTSALQQMCTRCLACIHLATSSNSDEEGAWDDDRSRAGGAAMVGGGACPCAA